MLHESGVADRSRKCLGRVHVEDAVLSDSGCRHCFAVLEFCEMQFTQ